MTTPPPHCHAGRAHLLTLVPALGGHLPQRAITMPSRGHVLAPTLGRPAAYLGMDSDIWKFELSIFASTKNVNMDIRIRIHF
jgi:hypothetical protein